MPSTNRPLAPTSRAKKFHKRGALPPRQCGPDNNEKVPRATNGKYFHMARQNTAHPTHNVSLHRLSPPSSPSGTLAERVRGSIAEDETLSDRIDERRVLEEVDVCPDLPFSTTPHFHTPDPREVEQFLESVIDALAPPSSLPPGSGHVDSGKPALAVETHNLPVNHLAEGVPSSASYSPTQTAVDSLPSASLMLDHNPSLLLGDAMMPPLSASTIEECRKHLVPVLLTSAQARDPGERLNSEQCLRLLSDDHCKTFFWQAKEMRLQLSSLVSQQSPAVNRSESGSLKHNRVDEVDTWTRKTRTRFDSTETLIPDALRRDSDITLVDFAGHAGKLPPRAPRAMLQSSQAVYGKFSDDALVEAPCEPLVASPTIRPTRAPSLIELVHQAIKIIPMLVTEMDASHVPMGNAAGDASVLPDQAPLTRSSASPSTPDFVSHLPTQPGVWFRQRGRQYAEIVDVDIEVSNEMFYMSGDRLRTPLRLCSVPMDAVTRDDMESDHEIPASLSEVHDIIAHRAAHWPKRGTLVVQVNPESERSKTWLPHALASDPLDVTSCVRPGKNTFRFIQLSDLSGFAFVLLASSPPPEDAWRDWDWESSIARSRSRASSTDEDRHGLAEFAHLPITVRS